MKGLSFQGPYALELDQAFIELSIDSTTLQQMSTNPLPIPWELSEGSHSIWDYLHATPLAKQHFVIIGPPGSGKTTLLKHITLTFLADDAGTSEQLDDERVWQQKRDPDRRVLLAFAKFSDEAHPPCSSPAVAC